MYTIVTTTTNKKQIPEIAKELQTAITKAEKLEKEIEIITKEAEKKSGKEKDDLLLEAETKDALRLDEVALIENLKAVEFKDTEVEEKSKPNEDLKKIMHDFHAIDKKDVKSIHVMQGTQSIYFELFN